MRVKNNNSLKNYGLCLSHYLTQQGITWIAMLNMNILFKTGTRGEFLIFVIDVGKPTITI